jgi:putative flavoprotein involved in K+ transport
VPKTQTLIVGAGQAGLALSWHLGQAGHDHVLLERGRMGERWRSERWESLTLLSPNWMNHLPGSAAHADPDGFLGRADFVGYLDAYARSIGAPVRTGVTVLSVERNDEGFVVGTDRGDWQATNVVVATGDCDVPSLPPAAATVPAALFQLHTARYRSPAQLPAGGALVVGAGPSGQQLALELVRAGRAVVLAVGRHARMVRRYRGGDIFHWLAELGDLDRLTAEFADLAAAKLTPSLPITGGRGGEELNLRVLHEAGVVVAGRLRGFSGGFATFADDLEGNVEEAEQRLRRVLAKIDEHVARLDGADVPAPEPIPAVTLPRGPELVDLRAAGISTVIWATGYRRSYPWLRVPVLDAGGELIHDQGVTPVPGLYALGLRFQRTRKSHFIGGVGEDAELIAARILGTPHRAHDTATQRAAEPARNGKEQNVNLETVKSIPLFASVPKRRHLEVASLADDVDVPAGTTLTREGGYAREFFVVVSGTADVHRDGEHVATLGPGDFFGEVGLLGAKWERNATVVAASPMRLLVLARRDFQRLVFTLPAVAEPVLRAAAERA